MKKGFIGVWALMLIASILLAIFAFGAGFWLSNRSVDEVQDYTSITVPGYSVTPGYITEAEEDIEVLGAAIVESGETLAIDWYPSPIEIDIIEGLDGLLYPELTQESAMHVLGVVSAGEYYGYELVLLSAVEQGLGSAYVSVYFLVPDGETDKPVVLDRYGHVASSIFVVWSDYYSILERKATQLENASDDYKSAYNQFVEIVEFDVDAVITEFEYDDLATDSLGNEYKLLGASLLTYFPDELDLSEPEFVSYIDGAALYQIPYASEDTMKNLFVYEDAGGRIIYYDINIPFWNYDGETELNVSSVEDFSGVYTKTLSGGCGWAALTNVVDGEEIGELVYAGSVSDNGIDYDLYEPEVYSMELYLFDYEVWNSFHEGTFEEFLELHPFLYYQDSLGRWIEFKHADIISPAECGKPVIYLYPEEEMEIDVYVDPQGGFTYTEPEYGEGWSVIASPDGRIVNLADGQEYPYLFWEGHGGMYMAPENYWVIAQAEVESFLIEMLGDYGLNDQEIFDFMEFWYPRMQDAPYYKIGFHGTAVMDVIAPLELSVEPDSIFRILMDYSELDEPIEPNPPIIIPFEREGFAVVEWGGVIQ